MPAERMAKNRVGRYLSLLPALLTFGLGIYALTPPALNAGQEYFRRDDLSRDAEALLAQGVAAVYTPKDCDLNRIAADVIGLVDAASRREREALELAGS